MQVICSQSQFHDALAIALFIYETALGYGKSKCGDCPKN
jgi:hypothetical protein